jgi:hypothetical protein
MMTKQEVIAFIDHVSLLHNTAVSNAKTIEEVVEVKRLTIGKDGIFTLIQKEISEVFKK